MLFFPQFLSLSNVQYPSWVERRFRNVVTESEDGRRIRYHDAGVDRALWRLELNALVDSERTAVDALFASAEGSLRTFVFLDPFENLLARSEEFGDPAWVKDGGLQLNAGQADPWGTLRATNFANPTLGTRDLYQVITAPSDFHYCLSFHARSAAEMPLTVLIGAPGAPAGFERIVTTEWRRIVVSASPGGGAEQLAAGVRIGSGAVVDLCGFQIEAQPGASPYRVTDSRSGVHTDVRFQDDSLNWRTNDAGNHSTTLHLYRI